MSGNFAQIARCTRIASWVRPSSTDEPDLQAACEIAPETVATGLVADRYCALTQRDDAVADDLGPDAVDLAGDGDLGALRQHVQQEAGQRQRPEVHVGGGVLLPVTFGGVAFAVRSCAARVFAEVGFGIGACFFRCLAVGRAFGLGAAVGVVDVVLIGGRRASRLIVASRDSCRDELAIDGSS